MKKKLIASLLLLPCFFTQADDIECIALKKDNTIELELKSSDIHNNCFALTEVAANSPVQFIAYSNDNVRNKISLFELNSGASSQYIAEYNSDVGGANAFVTNTTNRNISFRILPTSHLTSDKNISLTYLYVEGSGQIIIDIDDIPSTAPTLPPIQPGCTYRAGVRICYEQL